MSIKSVKLNRTVKIATKAYPPLVNPCGIYTLEPDLRCPDPGVENWFLGRALASLGIDYELVPLGDEIGWGTIDGAGEYDGVLG